jgi:hypothetical protein
MHAVHRAAEFYHFFAERRVVLTRRDHCDIAKFGRTFPARRWTAGGAGKPADSAKGFAMGYVVLEPGPGAVAQPGAGGDFMVLKAGEICVGTGAGNRGGRQCSRPPFSIS